MTCDEALEELKESVCGGASYREGELFLIVFNNRACSFAACGSFEDYFCRVAILGWLVEHVVWGERPAGAALGGGRS